MKNKLAFFYLRTACNSMYRSIESTIPSLTTLFILCFLLSVASLCYGQSQSPQYAVGEIYLKLVTTSHKNQPSKNELKQEAISRLFTKYKVSQVKMPFAHLKTSSVKNVYRIRFDDHQSIDTFIEELLALYVVDYAEKIPLVKTDHVPNDPALLNANRKYHLELIKAFQAFDIFTNGSAKIAIVDDAVNINHEDLAANIWINPGEIPNNGIDDDNNGYIDDVKGYDVADNDPDVTNINFSHGTHCAGIASAVTNNGTGVASVGYNCKIIPIKVSPDNTYGYNYAYEGIAYAIAAGADVISLSWGRNGEICNTEEMIIQDAYNQGIVVIAAAGNDDTNSPHYPAAYEHVIAVASTDIHDAKSGFSNFGNWVDVSAPGQYIYSTLSYSNSSYGYLSGTSMSCPLVAGLCGLIKSMNPELTVDDIENRIKSTADKIDSKNPAYAGKLGGGRINAFNAIRCLTTSFSPYNNFSLGDQAQYIQGDWNGDDKDDLLRIIPNQSYANIWSSNGVSFSVSTFNPNIGISFGDASQYLVGDWNGDGKDDLLRIIPNQTYTNIWLSNGNGFSISTFNPNIGITFGDASQYLVGDWNDDGQDDLLRIIPNQTYTNIWFSNGSEFSISTFNPNIGITFGDASQYLVGDWNDDGQDDLLRIIPSQTYANIWSSNGTEFSISTFDPNLSIDLGDANQYHVGDWNGDNKDDLIRILPDQFTNIWTSNGSHFSISYYKPYPTYGVSRAQDYKVGDFNCDGRVI